MKELDLKDIMKRVTEKKDNFLAKISKYDKYFINRCYEAAKMSSCKRLQVGAVAVKDNRTILDGWNGTLSGQSNCCEEDCKVCNGTGNEAVAASGNNTLYNACKRCNGSGRTTKESTIHAERNIIFYAAKKGISLEGATMYITHSPCIGCAQAMAASGIKRVVYADDYRNDEGIKFLEQCKILTEKVEI